MLKKFQQLKNKKGFTLVELIVVIAVVAVLTAVIVPLVGRYSTQAAYTTLQDSAKTISDNLTTCMSTYAASGSPSSCTKIKGVKTNNSDLAVTFEGAGAGEQAVLSDIIAKSLDAALPKDCYFLAEISGGAVKAVIYTTDSVGASGTVTQDTDFNEAYMIGGKAVGLTGSWANSGATVPVMT